MGFDLTMRSVPEGLPEGFPGKAEGSPEWYRMSNHAMAIMATLLGEIGVLVDAEPPSLPPWPPHGLSEKRAETIHGGGEASPEERSAYDDWKRSYDATAATRSSDGVPSFKFASNEGWIVEPEECLAIAAALRACQVDDAFNIRVHEISAAINRAVGESLVASGYEAPPPYEFSMSTSELAEWLTEWAVWNETAATVGGYTVT